MDSVVCDRLKKVNKVDIPKGYKLAGKIGVIPIDWEVKKFKEIFKINQGLQIPISKRLIEPKEDSHFYITNEFIKNRGNDGIEYYIQNPFKSVICTKDDILMTRTGNTGIVLTNVEGVFHNNFFKINFDRNLINKNFLYYYLKSDYVQRMIKIYAGINTIPDLNHSDFYRIDFLFMDYKEQQKIASILSTWDKAIELKEKLIEQKKEQKKGLMQKLLTGEVRLPGFEGEWREGKIGDCITESREVAKKPVLEKRLTVRLNLRGIEKREVTPNEKVGATTQYIRRSGQFIYGKQNLHKGALGLIPNEYDRFQTSSDIPSFDFKKGVDPKWFFYFVSREVFYTSLERISTGTGSKRINPKDLYIVNIKVPEIREQKEIAKVLSCADKEIEILMEKLKYIKKQKKGLMQLLLTGKVRVKV